MKTRLAAAVGLAASLLLTSCVVDSVQPLSSPEKAQIDHRLMGVWRGKEGNLITFTPTRGAWLHFKTVGAPGSHEESGSGDVFPTTIGNYTLLNSRIIGMHDRDKPMITYIFIRYAISSNHVLRMWMMSQDAAANAVRSGKLKGQVQPTGWKLANRLDYDVTFQDTGVNLTKFIEGSDITALFNQEINPSEQ